MHRIKADTYIKTQLGCTSFTTCTCVQYNFVCSEGVLTCIKLLKLDVKLRR